MNQAKPTKTADISLVLCTYGRTEDVNNFLKSISMQTLKPSETIIIDQNEKDILSGLIRKWKHELNLIHKRVDFKGASKSRNYGAKEAKFSLIAFPDDDCLYPPSTIEKIAKTFETQKNVDTIITAKIEPSQLNQRNFGGSSKYSRIISALDLLRLKPKPQISSRKRQPLKHFHIFSMSLLAQALGQRGYPMKKQTY